MNRATTETTFSRTEIEELHFLLAVLETILAADAAQTGGAFHVAGETQASMTSWVGDVRVKLRRHLFPQP